MQNTCMQGFEMLMANAMSNVVAYKYPECKKHSFRDPWTPVSNQENSAFSRHEDCGESQNGCTVRGSPKKHSHRASGNNSGSPPLHWQGNSYCRPSNLQGFPPALTYFGPVTCTIYHELSSPESIGSMSRYPDGNPFERRPIAACLSCT